MKKQLLSALFVLLPALAAHAQDAPLYRMLIGNDHLYTTSCDEVQTNLRNGWRVEGIEGSLWTSGGPGLVPLYRAFAPRIPEHFYTASRREMRSYLRFGGRNNEGITGFVSVNPGPGLVPVHRMLLPDNLHFYTTDEAEHDRLLGTARDENIVGYISARTPDRCHIYQDEDHFPGRRRNRDDRPR